MNAEIKSWTEDTDDDFMRVVKSRFSKGAIAVSRMMLGNPMRRYCKEAGDIAYENGIPKVVQGAILRKMYYGKEMFWGVVGGMLAAEKDASPVSIVSVMKRTISSRNGSKMYFANSACESSLKMNRLLKVNGAGPDSCLYRSFSIVRIFPFLIYFIIRKVLRLSFTSLGSLPKLSDWKIKLTEDTYVARLLRIGADLDEFWNRYVESNHGVVCSRSVEELYWMYNERFLLGRVVMLAIFEKNKIQGYVVIKASDDDARRWSVLDIIAINNCQKRIQSLLAASKKFLHSSTSAIMLEISGFPQSAQRAIRKVMKLRTRLPMASYLWKITDKALSEKVGNLALSTESWFFGPYDGDLCM